MQQRIKAILFDFGGVIAEEGFYEGLLEIGRLNNREPHTFFKTVEEIIAETGYLTGRAEESEFWDAVRGKTGISMSDDVLKMEILNRFILRPEIISFVDMLKSHGFILAILSDQTNWLDEINRQTSLFQHFDEVFNSFHLHKSKRDATVFKDVCRALAVEPPATLFIDDNNGHVQRAQNEGLQVIHFIGRDDFEKRIRTFFDLEVGKI